MYVVVCWSNGREVHRKSFLTYQAAMSYAARCERTQAVATTIEHHEK